MYYLITRVVVANCKQHRKLYICKYYKNIRRCGVKGPTRQVQNIIQIFIRTTQYVTTSFLLALTRIPYVVEDPLLFLTINLDIYEVEFERCLFEK